MIFSRKEKLELWIAPDDFQIEDYTVVLIKILHERGLGSLDF
jgi:hypothetical protein